MNEPSEKLTEAIALHQEGKPEAAIVIYQEHLACQPDDAQAIYLLGTALLQLGKGEESIEYLKRAEDKFPHIPDVPNNAGIAYQSIGDWEQAEKAFQRSIQINPDYGQAYFNYGSLLHQNGRLQEAEQNLKQAVRLSPGDCEVMGKYADVLKDQQKWKEASESYQSMINLPQVSLDSMVNFAFVLIQQNRLDEAIEVYAQIINKKPDYYQVYNSLGYLLEKQGKLKEALSLIDRALEFNPEFAEGWNNKGVVLKSLYQFEEAKDCFEKALSIAPDFSLSKFNLGTTLLIQEQYQAGWEGFSHHTLLNNEDYDHDEIPVWNGEAIPEKKLLVYMDQGSGDAIMFIRFLDELKKQSQAKLIIESPKPLIQLFQSSFSDYDFIVEGEGIHDFDFRFPISQSPVVLNLAIEELPLKTKYILASESVSDDLKEILNKPSEKKRKIGICWQGNSEQARDHVRSCPLLLLEILFDEPDIEWHSFQVDDISRKQLHDSDLTEKVIDLGEKLESFSETSYALSKMDLMISVDTSMAHLAGAMGIPTWVMLCHLPDWRWHLQRADSPWYPGMKLFRQPGWGDWSSLITDLKIQLK